MASSASPVAALAQLVLAPPSASALEECALACFDEIEATPTAWDTAEVVVAVAKFVPVWTLSSIGAYPLTPWIDVRRVQEPWMSSSRTARRAQGTYMGS